MASIPLRYEPLAQNDLAVSLTAPDAQDMAKPAHSVPMMEIIAPATLMEGFELETLLGDQVIKINIPPGGVAKGQTFTVPLPVPVPVPVPVLAPTETKTSPNNRYQVPVGVWKDPLCNCCHYGLVHATCCWGFFGLWLYPLSSPCCLFLAWPALGAAQVATRMNLDWLGRPLHNNNIQNGHTSAFTKFASITIAYVLLMILAIAFSFFLLEESMSYPWNGNSKIARRELYFADLFFLTCRMAEVAYFFLCMVIIYRIRRQVRQSFIIPQNDCCPSGKLEDCCVATFCGCCAASQMMRHTGDYEHYPAQCCSPSGFPEWVNAQIV